MDQKGEGVGAISKIIRENHKQMKQVELKKAKSKRNDNKKTKPGKILRWTPDGDDSNRASMI